ncbi:MAG: hypothetical protein ACE5EL_02055 [Anaerolineae bacterium]
MRDPQHRGIRRVAAVVVVTLAGVYAVNLAQLVMANRPAEAVEATLATEVAGERETVAAIETETALAGTDAYIERAIRDERHWAQPGDRVIVPISLTATPAATTTDGDNGDDDGFWQRLRRRLGAR